MIHWWFQPVMTTTNGLVLCAIMLVCVSVGIWYRPVHIRRYRWWLMHIPAFIALVITWMLLLNPVPISTSERLPTETPRINLAVLMDVSPSMMTTDTKGRLSRLSVAANAIIDLQAITHNDIELQAYAFADTLRPIDLSSPPMHHIGQTTRIYDALKPLLVTEPPPQHILLLTDGIDHSQANAEARFNDIIRLARNRGVNIHTMALGNHDGASSVHVYTDHSQITARPGQQLKLQGRLQTEGFNRQQLRAMLRLNGRIIARQSITIESPSQQRWSWTVQPDQPGLHLYQMQLDNIPLPSQHGRPTATMLVRVLDKPVKVLIIEGQPNWRHQSLVRLLQADPLLEVTSLARLDKQRWLYRYIRAHTEPQGDTTPSIRSFTTANEGWSVIDQSRVEQIIKDNIKSETDVLLISQPIEALFSTTLADHLLRVVRDRSLGLMCYGGNNDLTANIITGDTRVTSIINTIHQLALQREHAIVPVSLRSSKLTYANDENIVLELRTIHDATKHTFSVVVGSLDDASIPVTLVTADNPPTANLQTFTLKPMKTGLYHAVVRGHDDNVHAYTVFEVLNINHEMIELEPRALPLQTLSRHTGGLALPPGDIESLVDTLNEQHIRHQRESSPVITLWDRWWVLLTILGMFSLTWWLRRREGIA